MKGLTFERSGFVMQVHLMSHSWLVFKRQDLRVMLGSVSIWDEFCCLLMQATTSLSVLLVIESENFRVMEGPSTVNLCIKRKAREIFVMLDLTKGEFLALCDLAREAHAALSGARGGTDA